MELSALVMRARQQEAERKAKRMGLEDPVEANTRRIALYEPVANILRIQICKCKCGRMHRELDGLYLKSQHPRLPESRLVRADHETYGLPKELELTVNDVKQCLDCLNYEEYKET